jgi:hypothetical protein
VFTKVKLNYMILEGKKDGEPIITAKDFATREDCEDALREYRAKNPNKKYYLAVHEIEDIIRVISEDK